jgi:hypothetical protein
MPNATMACGTYRSYLRLRALSHVEKRNRTPITRVVGWRTLLLGEEEADDDDQYHRTKAAQPGMSIEEVAHRLRAQGPSSRRYFYTSGPMIT